MDFSAIVLLALLFVTTCFLSLRLGLGRRRKLPPGPFPLPIIGNMLQLIGPKPHESLAQLAKKYGPLMSLHLGSLHTVVVSSPEMAKEILQKHGQVFSGRPLLQAAQACDHDKFSMGFIPTGGLWRDMRKICKEEMFSHSSLEASEGLRQQKRQQLVDYVQRRSDEGLAVDVREAAFITTLNFMSATLFSSEDVEFDSELGRELKESVEGMVSIVGLANYADYFPLLKRFDLQGIKRKANICLGRLLGIMEGHLSERLESRRTTDPDLPKKNDLLEKLVDIVDGDQYDFTAQHITHLMIDLFAGGSDTTSTTMEWIMSELAAEPEKMAKVKDELNRVVGKKKVLEQSDVARLVYLQAVVKEVMRINPPGPFLAPRKAESDQEVNGYLIPKGTQIIVNVWAMGRDPSIWKNPDSFEPERFLGLETDYKGQDFELIPFGSGRRLCPGMPLADRMLHTTLATLLHKFDWKHEEGAVPDRHREAELCGGTLRRTLPLRLAPLKPRIIQN